MGNPWKHNLSTPEPKVRDTSMTHRVSGRVVSLAGKQFYAAGRMWPTREEAVAAAARMASYDNSTPARRR